MMNDKGPYYPLVDAIKKAYRAGEEDEELNPIVAVDSSGQPIGRFQGGDHVIFYDIRGEREIQITESLTDSKFDCFPIKQNLRLNFVTMIEYNSTLDVNVAFPPEEKIKNTLAEVVTKAGLRLLKIAESEKAIHVGFFMNGKSEEIFAGEERLIIESPSGVASYATKPEMSAKEVADKIVSKVKEPNYRLIIANFANVDVVGHVEDRNAILSAVHTVDTALGRVVEACRDQKIALIVTSDHGTVEEWLYDNGTINTGHTKNPVPFILADFSLEDPKTPVLKEEGELADVAPTILEMLSLPKPSEMTGESLLFKVNETEKNNRRILLLILDGWGLREEHAGNLISEAKTQNYDRLWSEFPHICLKASGEAVGMPPDTVGNSEAGHLHLGAGRRVFLDRVRIDHAIQDGSFFQNEAFLWAMHGAKRERKALHLLGIVSHYSSHGTVRHLEALLKMARYQDVEKLFIHPLIGRRGEKPESGAAYVRKVEEMCQRLSLGKVVTVMGRFWALDREENWDRVEKAYRALVYGEGTRVRV